MLGGSSVGAKKIVAAGLIIGTLFFSSRPLSAGEKVFSASLSTGAGMVSSRFYASVGLAMDIQKGNFNLGIAGRLRIAPQDIDTEVGPWRNRDFDEVSDFFHLLRLASYEHDFSGITFFAGVGEIHRESLGHGSIVRDYSNLGDPDHLHCGFWTGLRHEHYDFRFFLDNLAEPTLMGTRFSAAPISSDTNFRVGFSAALDARMPESLVIDGDGRPSVDPRYWRVRTSKRAMVLFSIDFEYAVEKDSWSVTPYVDLATSLKGLGLHAGWTGSVVIAPKWILQGQIEYRHVAHQHHPAQFSTFYDIERYQIILSAAADQSTSHLTFSEALERELFAGHGVMIELGLDTPPNISVKARYVGHPGPDGTRLWLELAGRPLRNLSFGALLCVRGLANQDSNASGLVAIAEARFFPVPNLFVFGQFARTWALADISHRFEPLLRFTIGVGGFFER